MKQILLFIVIICVALTGCSSVTGVDCEGDLFFRSTLGVIKPGKFTGTWLQDSISSPCMTIILEGDSILKGTIINSTTGEVLTIDANEVIVNDAPCKVTQRHFDGYDSTHANSLNQSFFLDSGNTFNYWLGVSHPISVNGIRQ